MTTPWKKPVKDAGKILYFNGGGAWSAEVDKAAATFNGLGFPVKYEAAKEKSSANVVVKLASGPDKETFDGSTLETGPKFVPGTLAGTTKTLKQMNGDAAEMIFAVVFLPGLAKGTSGQKEMIVVHEFMHACGVDGGKPDGTNNPDQDHDTEGVLFAVMQTQGDGLIEDNPPKGAKPMPPVRVGGATRCKILSIWGSQACPRP